MVSELRFETGRGWVGEEGQHQFSLGLDNRDKIDGQFLEGIGIEVVGKQTEPRPRAHAMRYDEFLAIRFTTSTRQQLLWRRDRINARRRFLYLFVSKGSIAVTQQARLARDTTAGVCLVFPGDTPVELVIAPETEAVAFSFDRDEIGPLADILPKYPRVREDSPVFRSAYAYLCGLVRPTTQTDEGTAAVLRQLTKSIAVALATDSVDQPTPTTDFVDVAIDLIDKLALRTDTTADIIADEIGTSRRTLERGFSARGMTVASHIRRVRALRARDIIDQQPNLDLADVASASGFSSVSTLRRAFVVEFDITPSTAQTQARTAQ